MLGADLKLRQDTKGPGERMKCMLHEMQQRGGDGEEDGEDEP